MSLLEVQNFLARLYTDEKLRREFLSEPEKVGKENNLNESEISELAETLPEELKAFAETLFYKRLRETEKILPLTRKALEKEFETFFREFAARSLPSATKKQFQDAVRFADFLQTQEIKLNWAKDLVKFEKTQLEFHALHKRFAAARFQYDIRAVLNHFSRHGAVMQIDFPKRKTFAVWFRYGNDSRRFIR